MLTTCMCKQCWCTFNTESSLLKSMCDTCYRLDKALCIYCGSEQAVTTDWPKCVNPKCPCWHRIEKALRYNEGKTRWSLVHFPSLEPMVEVLEYWTKKYAEENWKKPMDKKQILNSMMRHLVRLMEDEELDSESNLKHIGHIMCNALFYSYHSK